jgi:MATE family multidrug resistance protein
MDNTNDSKSWLPKFLQPKSTHTSTPPNEREPLIPKPGNSQSVSSSATEGETYEVDEDTSKTKQWLSEFLLLLRGSLPVILAYTLQNSLQTVSVLIVGRLSPEALATAAFSYMFAMSTAWLIALGGSTALDTLASSTFTGSKNPHDLGILLQRSFIVLTAFYVPVAILWACSAPVFRLLGQEEYICVDSARFLTALIPGGLGYIYFEAMKKYLQAQGLAYCILSPDSTLTCCQKLCGQVLTSSCSHHLSAPDSITCSYTLSSFISLVHHSPLDFRIGYPSSYLSCMRGSSRGLAVGVAGHELVSRT